MCQHSLSCFSFHVCRPSGLHDKQRRQLAEEKTSEMKRKGEKGDERRRTQKHTVTLPLTPLTHTHTRQHSNLASRSSDTSCSMTLCVSERVMRATTPPAVRSKHQRGPQLPTRTHHARTHKYMHICTIQRKQMFWGGWINVLLNVPKNQITHKKTLCFMFS